jgi:hypothetical protein
MENIAGPEDSVNPKMETFIRSLLSSGWDGIGFTFIRPNDPPWDELHFAFITSPAADKAAELVAAQKGRIRIRNKPVRDA